MSFNSTLCRQVEGKGLEHSPLEDCNLGDFFYRLSGLLPEKRAHSSFGLQVNEAVELPGVQSPSVQNPSRKILTGSQTQLVPESGIWNAVMLA